MGVLDLARKLRPRLPQLTPTELPSIWAVDPAPEERKRSEYSFLFLVGPDEEDITVLANRTGGRVALFEGALLEEHNADEKTYMEPGERPLIFREFRLLTVEEAATRSTDEDGIRTIPPSLRDEPIEPRDFTVRDAEALAEALP